MPSIPSRIIVLAVALAAAGCAAAEPAVDYAAEEQAIRDIDASWNEALAAGDVATIVGLYAEDGYAAPPNAEPAQGAEALTAMWTGMLSLPDLDVRIEPVEIELARAGDIAWENGTYHMAFGPADERVEDHGKYVVVWEKVDGQWKVAADIFNSSVPAP